jgi:acetyltransferase-like isoleucine patch superfamily enzyme
MRISRKLLAFAFHLLARPARHGGHDARINGFTRFNKRTRLGRNFNTNGLTISGGGSVTFGNNFHSGKGIRIFTSSHRYDGTMIPYDREVVNYDVVIGDQVWLGEGVMIVGNVTIGEGAIVQAGSVVSSAIPAFAIAGGNPARVFKQRDIAIYEENRKNGRFH